MADIVERLILDDSGFTPVMEEVTKATEEATKEFEKYKKEVSKATKEVSKDVVDSEAKVQEATKKTAAEHSKAKQSLFEYIKTYSIYGVSIGSIIQKLSGFKEKLTGVNATIKDGTALTATQKEGVNTLAKALGGGQTAITAFARGFNILKAAIISTGIGALIIALGGLISYFTKTQAGIDKVSKAMSYVRGVAGVLTDKLSSIGESLVNAFDDPTKALKDFGQAILDNIFNRFIAIPKFIGLVGKAIGQALKRDFKGAAETIGEAGQAVVQFTTGLDSNQQTEFVNGLIKTVDAADEAGNAMTRLSDRKAALRQATIALTVEEAKSRAAIAGFKKDAEDTTKSYGVRLEAARKAVEVEQGLLNKKIKIAQENANIIASEKALSNSLASDEAEVAEAYAEVSRLKAESIEKQIELNNKLNGLVKEAKDSLNQLSVELVGIARAYNLITAQEEFDFAKANQIVKLEEMRSKLESISTIFKEGSTEKNAIVKQIDLITQAIEGVRNSDYTLPTPEFLPTTKETALKKAEALGVDINSAIGKGLSKREGKELNNILGYDIASEINKAVKVVSDNPIILPTPKFKDPIEPSFDFVKYLSDVENFGDLLEKVLYDAFDGVTADKIKDVASGLGSFISEYGNILNEATNIALDQNDKQLAELDKRKGRLEKELEDELALREKGLANNVGSKQEEVDALLAEENRLNLEREKLEKQAAKRQLIADTIQQGQSLITSSINIIKGFSSIPVVGLPLGIAAVGTLLAFFAKTKADAFKATKLYTGAEKISDHFGYGQKFGDSDLNGGSGYRLINERSGKPTNVIISGNEMLLPERISRENETFFNSLRAGYYNGLNLDEAVMFYKEHKGFEKRLGGSSTIVNNITTVKSQAVKKERAWIPFKSKDGRSMAILKTISEDMKDGSIIELDF